MFHDVLPFVYQMINLSLRDVGIQLFNDDEKRCFRQAIELMITFDIKLLDISPPEGFAYAMFSPDIGSLVTYGPKGRLPMRIRT